MSKPHITTPPRNHASKSPENSSMHESAARPPRFIAPARNDARRHASIARTTICPQRNAAFAPSSIQVSAQERTRKRTARKAHRQRRSNEKSDYKRARPKCDSLRRHEIYAGIGHNSNGKQHARNLADPARNNRNPHAPGKKIRKNKKARTRDKRSKEHCSVCEYRYRRRPHKQHYKTFRLAQIKKQAQRTAQDDDEAP